MDIEYQGSDSQEITMKMVASDGLVMHSVLKVTENETPENIADEFIARINQSFGGRIQATRVNRKTKKLNLKLNKSNNDNKDTRSDRS